MTFDCPFCTTRILRHFRLKSALWPSFKDSAISRKRMSASCEAITPAPAFPLRLSSQICKFNRTVSDPDENTSEGYFKCWKAMSFVVKLHGSMNSECESDSMACAQVQENLQQGDKMRGVKKFSSISCTLESDGCAPSLQRWRTRC